MKPSMAHTGVGIARITWQGSSRDKVDSVHFKPHALWMSKQPLIGENPWNTHDITLAPRTHP